MKISLYRIVIGLLLITAFSSNILAKSTLTLKSKKFESYDTKRIYNFNNKRYYFYRKKENKPLYLKFFPKNTIIIQAISKKMKKHSKCSITINSLTQEYQLEHYQSDENNKISYFCPISIDLPSKETKLSISTHDESIYFRVFEKEYIKEKQKKLVSLIPNNFQKEFLIKKYPDSESRSYFSSSVEKPIEFKIFGKKEITLYARSYGECINQNSSITIMCNNNQHDYNFKNKKSSKYFIQDEEKTYLSVAKKIVIKTEEEENNISILNKNNLMIRILIPKEKNK